MFKHRANLSVAMSRSVKMRRAGNESGALEAEKAIAALGNIVTKDKAHIWLNRAVAVGIVGKSIEDAEAWEWGCRIMFMLKVRRLLVD
jgi:hypothetical protein